MAREVDDDDSEFAKFQRRIKAEMLARAEALDGIFRRVKDLAPLPISESIEDRRRRIQLIEDKREISKENVERMVKKWQEK